ncbi:ERCC4 domain-containing protein [Paenibacillus sanguinis]|uniref:ERCC4 domain-containing protein n=1 Tax=Paenibacillus sanguinis TaxID=225906 RepID=UPI00036F6F8E|nr:ERCC4 domain-containing protein [Paenibacillus sanguinis]
MNRNNNFGYLLDELIDIAQKPKTDFAISMNMTPSGLSKILTGSRLPSIKEKKLFIQQAADYFAESIYSHGCYLKLINLFPVIYNFRAMDDLRTFLTYALEFALDNDMAPTHQVNLEFSKRGFFYLGTVPVLNMLCIIMSHYVNISSDESLEVFSTIPTYDPAYSDILRKTLLFNPDKCTNVIFNQFFDGTIDESSMNGKGVSINFITLNQRGFNMNLWSSTGDLGQPFLLFKGKLLLMFDSQIDGTPLLIPIVHRNYLTLFYNSLMNKDIRKISYGRSEIIELLQNNDETVTKVLERGIDSVYSFLPIAYLLEKHEIQAMEHVQEIRDFTWRLFQSILNKHTEIFLSRKNLDDFIASGKVIIPFIGTYPLPPEERIPYMQRMGAYMQRDEHKDKFKVIDNKLKNIVILYVESKCLIYAFDDEYALEKIHVFDSDKVKPMLDRLMLSKSIPLKFSGDMWQAYQEDLLSKIYVQRSL